jgi:hypothetical protein
MKARFYGLFLVLLSAVVLTSCEKDDDIRLSDVPVAVMSTFDLKFPNAGYTEWEKKKGYYVADFWQEGMDTHAWIDPKGEWKMTELDFGANVQLLPEFVRNAFQSSKYGTWRVDDIDKYERYDCTFYLIEIETKGEKDRDLYYDESGVLLKDEVDKENNDVTPDTKL